MGKPFLPPKPKIFFIVESLRASEKPHLPLNFPLPAEPNTIALDKPKVSLSLWITNRHSPLHSNSEERRFRIFQPRIIVTRQRIAHKHYCAWALQSSSQRLRNNALQPDTQNAWFKNSAIAWSLCEFPSYAGGICQCFPQIYRSYSHPSGKLSLPAAGAGVVWNFGVLKASSPESSHICI